LFARRINLRHVPTLSRDPGLALGVFARHQAGTTPDDAPCKPGGVLSILISFQML